MSEAPTDRGSELGSAEPQKEQCDSEDQERLNPWRGTAEARVEDLGDTAALHARADKARKSWLVH